METATTSGGSRSGAQPHELAEGGETQPGVVRRGALSREQLQRPGRVPGIPPYEQGQALGEGVQDPVVPLQRAALPQQGEHTGRFVQKPHEARRGGPADGGVGVPRQPDEHLGSRRAPRPRPVCGDGPRRRPPGSRPASRC